MKKKATIQLLAILVSILLCKPIIAQNTEIDISHIKAEYEIDFTKDFKISFKGGNEEKKKVIITPGGGTPSVVSDGVVLKNFEIPFTGSKNGTAGFIDKKNKNHAIKEKAELVFGDKKTVIKNKKAVTTDNPSTAEEGNIEVDLKKPEKEYKADLSRPFNISFKNSSSQKVKVTITPKDPDVDEIILNASVALSKFIIEFKKEGDEALHVEDKDGNSIPVNGKFLISIGKNSFMVINDNSQVGKGGGDTDKHDDQPKDKISYWSYIKNNKLEFDLSNLRILTGSKYPCCDNCSDCDDDAFVGNNRIIYDARSGLTYFIPASDTFSGKQLCGNERKKFSEYKVDAKHKILVPAGDPLVYIVENVNPALYDIELSDSCFLTNNETTAFLESLLLEKAEGTSAEKGDLASATGGADIAIDENEQRFAAVKTGLLLVRAEMWKLLENLRRSSPYMHNCIQANKRQALDSIDNYPKIMLGGYYSEFTFIQLVDMFFNQETEDSVINRQIKVLYGEFVAASYKIAYRYPQIPERDILNFKLSIIAKPNSPYPSLLNVRSEHPTQTAYIKNFFKVDVSSGMYVGFLKDKTYSIQPDSSKVKNSDGTADSTTYFKRIIKEDDGNLEIGFASFLHFYCKYSKWFNIGGTIGAGLSFDKTVRTRYFTGISFMFGTNNRICLNGGLVWGNYEDLSNKYKKTGDNYDMLDQSETTLNYVTRFKKAGFVSISYNIPFLKRSKTSAKPKENETKPEPDTPKKDKEDPGAGDEKKDKEKNK